MATIGTLAVNVVTRVGSGFSKPLQTANQKLGGFVGGLQKINPAAASVVTSLAPVITTVAAVTRVVADLDASFARLDALGKLADQTDIAISDLRGLMLGSRLVGSSVEALEKGVLIFTRRLGEAAHGTGEARKALEFLGIEAKDLSNQDLGQSIRQIADRIKELPSAAERAGVAYQLFGREGVKLVALFNQGAEGIDALVAEAEELGGAFDRVDVSKVEAANDAIARLGRLWDGLIDSLAIQLAPEIQSIVDHVTLVGKGVRELLNVMRSIRDGFWYVVTTWTPPAILARELGLLEDKADDAASAVQRIVKEQDALNDALEETGEKVAQNNKLQSFADSLYAQTRTPLEQYMEQMARIKEGIDAGLIDYRTAFRGADQARAKLEATFEKPIEVKVNPVVDRITREVEQLFEQTRTPLEKYQEQLARLQLFFNQGLIDNQVFQRAVLQAKERLDDLTKDKTVDRELTSGPAALQKGSAAALSAILAANRQNDKPQQQTAQNTATLVQKQDDLYDSIQDLLDAFNKRPKPKPVVIGG